MQKASVVSKGSRLGRLRHAPNKYIFGQVYKTLFYPISKRGIEKECVTFFGSKMHIILPASMDIYLTGIKTHDSEIRLSKFLIKNLKTSDHFVDVGAHFGFFSLLASNLVGDKGTVLSLEASSQIFKNLSKNTSTETNIEVMHIACMDKSGEVTFNEFPILFSEYNSLDQKQYTGAKWFKKNPPVETLVQGERLDNILGSKDIQPKIIKIDVEGAEDMVIRGMKQVIATNADLQIVVEYIKSNKENSPHADAVSLLRKWGLSPFTINDKGSLEKVVQQDLNVTLTNLNIESENFVFKRV